MKQNKVAANSNDRLVQFRLRDAQRIANAVHAYESGRRDGAPSTLPRAVGSNNRGLTEAFFWGAWPKDEIKQVSFAYDTTGTSTASAYNYLCSIQAQSGPENSYRRCIVMPGTEFDDNAEYALVNAEC